MAGRKKKDGTIVNCIVRQDIYERFDAVCKKFGQSKTAAVERALLIYVEKKWKK